MGRTSTTSECAVRLVIFWAENWPYQGTDLLYYLFATSYGPTFFESAQVSLNPYAVQLMLGGVSVAGTIPALRLLDILGRRKMLIWGALLEAGCGTSSLSVLSTSKIPSDASPPPFHLPAFIAGLTGHFTLAPTGTPADQITDTNKKGGAVLIAFAVIQIMCFSLFWGATPWVYLGESFPLRVRPKGIALGAATNWIWNFILSFFAPKSESQSSRPSSHPPPIDRTRPDACLFKLSPPHTI
jgi:SP family sugar:H+ symporter-like MFS transporter